ncbi:heavy metal ABC transporter substrate-binding protein [Corynebacterium humireducens NBRC 106098 = DSM 45392]|uniref:Heavy metal ABC transporter substrate-binding protein n=1 Tax=Corynebacterium humireducens NBRC 106098 = DSM 45392 TaxID=1223515 RepID=A0A0B5DBW9_9CORY|nr:metal ABC transporter substrate-binding protein [Corynebacterium humireducens]AJE33653.1 heavy metal ABC transporter substrate-binding protein [Corynebacterium humireducens NBRC 106098 = DSM 45392]
MRARTTIGLAIASVTALTLSACSDAGKGGATTAAGDDISIVATTTPLGSVVEQIATCAGGTASTLMPVNADPHQFSASSAQVADMVKADLVVANGLGLEGGLDASLQQVAADGTEVFPVAEHVDPLPWGADDHGDHEGHDEHADHDEHEGHGENDGHEGHAHGEFDPHFWLDASRMATAAQTIGDKVADLTGNEKWATCGAEISDELTALDDEIRDALADIPEERRVIVTDHQAYGYFNKAYDFHSAGVVIPGGSTEAQPSSQELAGLADVIRAENVPVIFTNAAVNQRLVDALAAEVGGEVKVVSLYEGSVGPKDGPAADYQGMMRENARLISEALA